MSVQLSRPRVSELVLQLFTRPLHPELFDTLATQTLERGQDRVTLRITRTGHVLVWECGSICLTEVAGAFHEPLPERRRVVHQRLRHEHQGQWSAGPLQYQMNCQVEILPPDIFLHIHDEILADGARRGFLYNFQPNHRLALAPLGFLALEGRSNGLVVHAFHTFPDEHTLVKSQSLIELR